MFFVDAICQQYFIPILRKFQHFPSHKQSFMFSFMYSNQQFIVGKHSTMVENHIEKTWCLKRFSTSPRLRITLNFRNELLAKSTIWYFPNSWLMKSWPKIPLFTLNSSVPYWNQFIARSAWKCSSKSRFFHFIFDWSQELMIKLLI